jgi:DNA polymerase-2
MRGFLLTRHWRDVSDGGVEVEFWLATDDGPCRLRLPAAEAVAFVPAEHEAALRTLLQRERGVDLRPLALCDFRGRPVLGLYCRHYRHLLRLEKRLREHGIDVYEADIRPPERYLMERFITAPVAFTGTPAAGDPALLLDAHLKPAPDYRPRLRTVSLDIETTMQGELRSIALEGCGQRQVYMLGPPNGDPGTLDFDLAYCDTRLELLEQLEAWMARHDPDAIIGWSVIQFDLRVLQEHAERLQHPLRIGRGGSSHGVAHQSERRHRAPGAIISLVFPAAWSSTASRRCARPPGAFRRSAWNTWRKACWARARRSTIPTTAWPRSTACSPRTSRRWRATT